MLETDAGNIKCGSCFAQLSNRLPRFWGQHRNLPRMVTSLVIPPTGTTEHLTITS